MNEVILMACGDCKRRNYATTKNRKKHPEKLERKKLCPWCGKHTVHKETKAS